MQRRLRRRMRRGIILGDRVPFLPRRRYRQRGGRGGSIRGIRDLPVGGRRDRRRKRRRRRVDDDVVVVLDLALLRDQFGAGLDGDSLLPPRRRRHLRERGIPHDLRDGIGVRGLLRRVPGCVVRGRELRLPRGRRNGTADGEGF